jgi:hypothetical protein
VLHLGNGFRSHIVQFLLSRGLLVEGLDKEFRVLPVLNEDSSEAEEEKFGSGYTSGSSSIEG